jgi:hypothetical protein
MEKKAQKMNVNHDTLATENIKWNQYSQESPEGAATYDQSFNSESTW